ncbi:MAG TPA: hypothetical protein VFB15_06860 [Candidatus Binataceae bacterium]|jgi:hypothetical protein|nr:hypothetical protein [Candidatus Binataceae bacterium]
MAALTNSRNTPEFADGGRLQVYPVEANTTIYLGSIVALDANGNAVPASSQAGLKIVGRADQVLNGIPGQDAVNNPGAAGAISIVVRRGVFMYGVNDNSIGAAQVGLPAYAVDDNSVSLYDGSGATAVTAQAIALPASSAPQIFNVGHENISGLVLQSSASGGTVYVEGVDYVVDYPAGLVMLIQGGHITPGGTVYASYNWGAPTRSVAGRIVNLDPSGQVWVDFWHQSTAAV